MSGKNIVYQKISQCDEHLGSVNTHALNDYTNQINVICVTIVDRLLDSTDLNIYYDFIQRQDYDYYQIHLNGDLFDEVKFLIVLSEIFNNETNKDNLESLMKPLFQENVVSTNSKSGEGVCKKP